MNAVPDLIATAETPGQLQLVVWEYWQQGGCDAAVDDLVKTRLGEDGYAEFLANYRAFDDEMETNLNRVPARD